MHHDIKTKYLNQYVNNRVEILKETMTKYECTRDEAKTLFISLMYVLFPFSMNIMIMT